jgi:hypothetical protein
MVDKGPQVGWMYGLMTNQIIGAILLGWMVQNRKQVFMLFLDILEPFGHPQMDSKKVLKGQKLG